jgi:hypothetical protein
MNMNVERQAVACDVNRSTGSNRPQTVARNWVMYARHHYRRHGDIEWDAEGYSDRFRDEVMRLRRREWVNGTYSMEM